MKKQLYFVTLLFLLAGYSALAQVSVPTVPERLTFAGISVQLDPDAQRIIQQDVKALMANRQYWTAKLDRVILYFPLIEGILIDEDVPTDFKFLAVQESSLTPDAVSSSMAVGYWQFKQETAVDNGMRVDGQVDERKSITASTRGAAKYLKKSNKQFNNWVASLYSYYLGAGGITKLIPPDWAYAREVALDGRTDRYILRFFAHKVAIENALQTHQPGNRFALVDYTNGGGKSMRTIADELGVDEFELRKYNRWVLADAVPTDKPYIVAVPVPADQINDVRQKMAATSATKVADVIQNDVGFPVLRRVTTGLSSKNEPVLYEINGLPGIQAQEGDNAGVLARKSKISLSSFLRYNDMSDRDPIIPGDVYYLAKKRKKALVPFHTVREDETTRSISQRYGIRLKKLMRYNRLDRIQKLATGRVMWLRERRPANKPVEIITAPTAPVYDPTPAPTRPETVAVTSSGAPRPVSGSTDVPRNASERKLYQPKLVGGGVTPNDGTSPPATPQRTEPTSPASQPTVMRSVPATSPASEGSQRVVIVRTPDAAQPAKTVPVATTPERAKPTDTYTATPRPKPIKQDTSGDKYAGASEQQADGSLTSVSTPTQPTKAPPRPAATATPKPETRPAVVDAKPSPVETPVVEKTVETKAAPAVDRSAITHTVEPGQTYYSISKLYDLSVEELLTLNNLTANDVLEVGKKLTVKLTPGGRLIKPSPSVRADAGTSAGTTASSPKTMYHTVVKGETMFSISKQYDVPIEQIQTWNNLNSTQVNLGQKIKIIK